MKEDNTIEERMRQLLVDVEVQPKLSSFEAVVQKLEKKKRRRFLIFIFAGFVFFLAGFLTWQQTLHKTQKLLSAHKEMGDNRVSGVQFFDPEKKRPKADLKNAPSSVRKMPEAPETKISKVGSGSIVASEEKMPGEPSFLTSAQASKQTEQAEQDKIQPVKTELPLQIAPGDRQLQRVDTLLPNFTALPVAESFLFLQQKSLVKTLMVELLATRFYTFSEFSISDSLQKRKRLNKREFYLGFQFSPQINRFELSDNPKHSTGYATIFSNYDYLQERKKTNPFYLAGNFGLKAGCILKEKYEFFLGIGFQSYQEFYQLDNPPPRNTITNAGGVAYNASEAGGSGINVYSYFYYMLEASRIYKLTRHLSWKAGGGVQISQLLRQRFLMQAIGRPVFVAGYLKAGLIYKPGERFQLQLNPGLYYAPQSMLTSDFFIRQRPYGFQMEVAFLFKLN